MRTSYLVLSALFKMTTYPPTSAKICSFTRKNWNTYHCLHSSCCHWEHFDVFSQGKLSPICLPNQLVCFCSCSLGHDGNPSHAVCKMATGNVQHDGLSFPYLALYIFFNRTSSCFMTNFLMFSRLFILNLFLYYLINYQKWLAQKAR